MENNKIPSLRAIRDWTNEKINKLNKSLVILDQQYYLDEQGGKWGVNTDPERGADTFVPFKSDDSSEGGQLSSPLTIKVVGSGYGDTAASLVTDSYFPIKNTKKMVVKSLSLSVRRATSDSPSVSLNAYIYGQKSGYSSSAKSYNVSASTTSTNYATKTVNDEEIDLSDFEEVEYFEIRHNKNGSTTYPYEFKYNAEIELYF